MKKSLILCFSVFLVVGLGFVSPVFALMLTPGDGNDILSGNDQDNDTIMDAVETFLGFDLTDPNDLVSLYKDEIDKEEGAFWDSYTTTYSNYSDPPDNPRNATIEYDGLPDPSIDVSSGAWLIVKNGKAIPNWYLYNLLALGWTGTEDIELVDFFVLNPSLGATRGGSISHVDILGPSPVPEPATILLLGSGLIGLAGYRTRRRFKK